MLVVLPVVAAKQTATNREKVVRRTKLLENKGRTLNPCFEVEPGFSSLFAAHTISLLFPYESVKLGNDGQLHHNTKEGTSPYAANVEKLRGEQDP